MRGGSASFNGIAGFLEVIPGERIHVGANHEVGVAFPGIELMLLCGADCAGHDLKHILGRSAMAVLNADGNSNNDAAAKLASRLSRHGSDKAAVGETARADLNWFKQTGEGAAGADCFNKRPLAKDDRIASGQVCGDDGEGNLHVFELRGIEDPLNQVSQAVIAGESKAGNAPTRDIAKTDGSAGGENPREWRAAGVGGSEDAADAGTSDV